MTAWTCRWEMAKWPESLRVSSATGDPGSPRAASTPRPSGKRGQAPWGLQSAVARRAAKASRDQCIIVARAEGMTMRELGRVFKLSHVAVWKVLHRQQPTC